MHTFIMRRLILSGSDVPLDDTDACCHYLTPLKEIYARKYMIDFEYVQVKNKPDGRHNEWVKIPLLQKFIKDYDEILWMGACATILNHNVNVFEFIKNAPESAWRRDKDICPIAYALVNSNTSHANSGIVLLDCRNKDAAKEFLNNWWNDLGNKECEQDSPWDQSVWNDVWAKDIKKASRLRISNICSSRELDANQVFINLDATFKDIRLAEAKRHFARKAFRKEKRIGIFVRQQNYYSNGCGQNCIFIKQSYEAAGYEVDLLIERDPSKPEVVAANIPYFYKDCAGIDYSKYQLIICGSFIPKQDVLTQIKAVGVKIAMFHPMNSFDACHNEHFVYKECTTTPPLFEANFKSFADEVWITENHKYAGHTYLEIINTNSIPCNIIPLSWSPLFTYMNGKIPMYTPRTSQKVDIVIIEPYLSYSKNAWMPLVIAKQLHKTGKLNKVYLFNAPNTESSKAMITSLDLPIKILPRMQINDIFNFFANPKNNEGNHVAFLSHQIHFPMNYAYYDIVNAGFPFIHNSHMLKNVGVGYYYDESISDAVSAIERSMTSHNIDTYLADAHVYFDKQSPYNETVVSRFVQLAQAPKVQIVVICANPARKIYMDKQLKSLDLKYPVHFFDAYTPANSTDYIKKGDIVVPNAQCCTRSHIAAIDWYVKQSNAPYVLVLEDDATLLRVGFSDELDKVLAAWKRQPTIDFISIGYLPNVVHGAPIRDKLHDFKKDGDLYWGIDTLSYTIWGAQAYVVMRKTAERMVEVLHKSTGAEVLADAISYIDRGYQLSNKIATIQPDSLLATYFNQGIVYPLLVVESAGPSTIWGGSRSWDAHFELGPKKKSDYYIESQSAV
jgi:GR25 family glycosyltransferase involved in LPS biosynthesis